MWNEFLAFSKISAARARSAFRPGVRLPPGRFDSAESGMFRDQFFLLETARQYGPVFKLCWRYELLVCIVGLARGTAFLRKHEYQLSGASVELDGLFAHGFIRNMSGPTHRKYRHGLRRALRPGIFNAHEKKLRVMVKDYLQSFAAQTANGKVLPDLTQTLRSLATDLLLLLFFGEQHGSRNFPELRAAFERLGPEDLVWEVGREQIEIFHEIKTMVELVAGTPGTKAATAAKPSCLQDIIAADILDDTMIGNLIYMVEMGRSDIAGLLRWIMKYLGEHPEIAKTVQSARTGRTGKPDRGRARAIVLETLRMDQSEALIRKVSSDIVFEGHLIPRGSYARICVWEAHKDAEMFPDPHAFDPGRFENSEYETDRYAPFGLDGHRCIAADLVISLAVLFVEELTGGFTLEVEGTAMARRNAYHWEPDPGLAVALVPVKSRRKAARPSKRHT